MRNTTHKLFKDKTLRYLHDACNICGVVKNHFLSLCMRYYRRYGKGLSYAKISKHLKTANQRADHHWKLAIDLCRNFDILFFEDLNLRGMKKLWGKQVSDLAFGAFMQKLKHQSHKRIRSVLKIGKWIPSTKCCCVCGHKNETLTLSDREWQCPKCHTHLDRDPNAAMNILKEGVASFRLGVVRPIVLFNRIVGCSVESEHPLLNSTNASA